MDKRTEMTSCKYRLLVVDVDGTLIGQAGTVSGQNRDAVCSTRDSGIYVSLCTGRSVASSRKLVEELGLTKNYHIYLDGAIITHCNGGKPIYEAAFDPGIVREMTAFAEAQGIDLEFATAEALHFARASWASHIKQEMFGNPVKLGPLSAIAERESMFRACIMVKDTESSKPADEFIERFQSRMSFTRSRTPVLTGVVFVNMVPSGLSKAIALQELAGHLGIGIEEVMAVGDGPNDIALLRAAGLGVAMGNSHDEVKRVADTVTVSVEEDGLAAAIRKYLLQEKTGK